MKLIPYTVQKLEEELRSLRYFLVKAEAESRYVSDRAICVALQPMLIMFAHLGPTCLRPLQH